MSLLKGVLDKLTSQSTSTLTQAWSFDASSPILAPPVSVFESDKGSNAIVFGTKDGKVFMIGDDAKLRWSFNIQEKISKVDLMFLDEETLRSISGSPCIADLEKDAKYKIIFGSELGKLYVLNLQGKLLWDFKVKASIKSSPVAFDINNDGTLEILFGAQDKYFYALTSKGKVLWAYYADTELEAPCAVLESQKGLQIIFGSSDGNIFSLDPQGKLLWKFKTNGKIVAKPVHGRIYGDDREFIVIGSHDCSLYVLSENGLLEWSFRTNGKIQSSACLADVNDDKKLEIIFGSCDDIVYLLSANGAKLWSYETDFWIACSPIVGDINNDGKLEIVVGSYDKSLYVLDAEGKFTLNYMPGIGMTVGQLTGSNDLLTGQAGQYIGKKLSEYKADGMVIGIIFISDKNKNQIIVGTNTGKLNGLICK